MDGLLFILSIAAVGLVMVWVLQNDRVPPGGPTRGLLAMRAPAATPPAAPPHDLMRH